MDAQTARPIPTWIADQPATSPGLGFHSAIAYDSDRQRLVVFGGESGGSNGTADTYTFDGSNWTLRTPATSPSGRRWHSMAYDPAIGKVVLFGGSRGSDNAELGDTWTWDGTTWTQQSPANSPPAGHGTSMVYDDALGKIVLLAFDQTWLYDGTNWTRQYPATTPPGRNFSVMAYDPLRAQVVMFGGNPVYAYEDTSLSDTWVYNGTTWTQKSPVNVPPARDQAAMTWDPATGRVVMFGGFGHSGIYNGYSRSDTWLWDGTEWQAPDISGRDSYVAPSPREGQLLAAYPPTGKVVLFGGYEPNTQTYPKNGYSLQLGPVFSLYSANVCANGSPSPCSASQRLYFVFSTAGTLKGVQFLTQGGLPNQDFSSSSGSCIQNGANHSYNAGDVCGVDVVFAPKAAGKRLGVVNLLDTNNNVIASQQLSGTGVAPLGLFTTPAGSVLASGLSNPRGLSVDAAGNVYVLQTGARELDKISPAGVVTAYSLSTTGSGGTAVDGAGNIFYGNNDTLYMIPVGSVTPQPYAYGLGSVDNNLQIDTLGNLWVTAINGNLYKVPTTPQHLPVLVVPGGTAISGGGTTGRAIATAMDAANNLYLADYNNSFLWELPANSTKPIALTTSDGVLSNPHGLAVDHAGNLYVTNNTGSTALLRYSAPFTNRTPAARQTLSTYAGNTGAVMAADGTLYLINGGTINRYVRSAGAPVDFGSIPNGTSSAFSRQQYENDGNAALSLSSIAASNNNFVALAGPYNGYPGCGSTLGVGATCALGFQFTPKSGGALTGSAIVTANSLNDPASTTTVALSGTATPGAQTITFTQPATPVQEATSATLSASSTSGLPVTFSLTGGTGAATLSGTNNSTITYGHQGTVQITASQPGNASYNAAAPVTYTVNVVAQSITFAQPASPVVLGSSATLTATSSAGLPVTFSIIGGTGAATLSSSNNATITYTGVGTVQITASQPGDAIHSAATPVSRTVSVVAPSSYAAPSTAVGSISAVQSAYLSFPTGGTLSALSVVTQGAAALDFAFVNGGTCATGASYAAADSCTVNFTFKPLAPGRRLGAIVARDGSGALLASSLLSGIGTGPQAVFTTPTPSTVLSGLSAPRGLTIDAAGNLYLKETGGTTLDKFTPSGVKTAYTIATAGGGVAVDGAGNLFYGSGNNIMEIAAGTTNSVTYASGVGNADNNLQVDSAGNLYVTDLSGNAWKVPAGTSTAVLLFPANTQVDGRATGRMTATAMDANDNLFLADYSLRRVYEVAAGTSTPVLVINMDTSTTPPQGIAVDPAGNVYLTIGYGSAAQFMRYSPPFSGGNAAHIDFYGSVTANYGVAITADGNLYTLSDSSVNKYIRAAGPTLQFPVTVPGSSSQVLQRFENVGNSTLNISSLATLDSKFQAAGTAVDSFVTACGSSLPPAGSCGIQFSFAPQSTGTFSSSALITDNSLNAAGVTQLIALTGTAKYSQTITFTQPATPAPLNSTATLSATSTSGLPVTFAIGSGNGGATLSGPNNATITYTSPGQIQIIASQAGNNDYSAATSVSNTVVIGTVFSALRVTGFPVGSATGVAQTVTVKALDQAGQVISNFNGTVSLTSSDTLAVLAASHTYTSSDAGSYTFPVTINTAGTQTLTATSGAVSGSQTGVLTIGYPLVLAGSSDTKFYSTGGQVWTSSGGGTPTSGLAVSNAGQVYSLNTANNALVRFGRLGAVQSGTTGATGGGLSSPTQLAVDGGGSVWIVNGNGTLSQFTTPAGVVAAISPSTGYAGPYSSPSAISVSISGSVWVANAGNNTVVEVIGAATPVAPAVNALVNGTTGARP